jgi:hypothetical protein
MRKRFVFPFLTLLSFAALAQSGNSRIQEQDNRDKTSAKDKKKDRYFCASATVTMADGTQKAIRDVRVGEKVKTCHNGKSFSTEVKEVEVYQCPDASLTAVYLRPVKEKIIRGNAAWPMVPALLLEATPQHQVQTNKGNKTMKQLSKNDILYHYESETGEVSKWKVGVVQTNARKVDTAYNLTTEEGSYLVENVIVLDR